MEGYKIKKIYDKLRNQALIKKLDEHADRNLIDIYVQALDDFTSEIGIMMTLEDNKPITDKSIKSKAEIKPGQSIIEFCSNDLEDIFDSFGFGFLQIRRCLQSEYLNDEDINTPGIKVGVYDDDKIIIRYSDEDEYKTKIIDVSDIRIVQRNETSLDIGFIDKYSRLNIAILRGDR